jgi:hypothetical protein
VYLSADPAPCSAAKSSRNGTRTGTEDETLGAHIAAIRRSSATRAGSVGARGGLPVRGRAPVTASGAP